MVDFRAAVVFGASGGIGGAFVRLLSEAHEKVYAVSRGFTKFGLPNVESAQAEITDEDTLKKLAEQIPDGLGRVVVATGVLHDEKDLFPEKKLGDLNRKNFLHSYEVNTVGPALAAKWFAPKLCKDSKSVFGAVTGRVGSIGDNRMGGWYAYRASKAALHMIIKNTAIEVGRKNKNAAIISLHPGTVDTSLSKPFQSGVPEGKLFTPEFSAGSMINIMNTVSPSDSGKIFAYDGEIIEY